MNPVPIMCGCLSWSSTIGNFITSFGILDMHIQDFLEALLPPEEFLKLKERPFYDRVERINDRAEAMQGRAGKALKVILLVALPLVVMLLALMFLPYLSRLFA